MAEMRATLRRNMLVLGGTVGHAGGLESYCRRATAAVSMYGEEWQATWCQTETAYFSPRRLRPLLRAWRRFSQIDFRQIDLVWLQWSTTLDLVFLRKVLALKVPVIVTPHFGANARIQRSTLLRIVSTHLLARVDRLGLLFPEQEQEISLPEGVPRSLIGTFLSQDALFVHPMSALTAPIRLIHAGRLGHGKGSFRMVALCEALRKRNIPFRAQIIGRGDSSIMSGLEDAIATAGLGYAVKLLGWMDETELTVELAAADVLVHLSQLDSFPLIVLEALATATIPIVANMTGARAMAERYGGLVVVSGDAGVSDAANWLAKQDLADLRRRMAIVAERVRREQAWEKVVTRVAEAANATIVKEI